MTWNVFTVYSNWYLMHADELPVWYFTQYMLSMFFFRSLEVNWGHIFGHRENKWHPSYEMLTGELLESLSFIWYVILYWIWNINLCGHWGHLRSHFQSYHKVIWNVDRWTTGVIIFHLICLSILAMKHSFLWSWRSSAVTEGQMTPNGYLIYTDELMRS